MTKSVVQQDALRIIVRSVVYFGIVFAVGFLLGVIRVIWLVPQVGERVAELAEAPLMLAAIAASARFVTRRLPAQGALEYLLSGLLALLLLLVIEFTVVLALQEQSVSDYLAARDPVAGGVYIIMLIVFAGMPWVLGCKDTVS